MTSTRRPDREHVFAHESSYVDEPCEIGTGTRIWHFCHVMEHSRIGRHCTIGQNVVVGPRSTIGNYVKVQNNVSIYTGVTLEDYVFCGPSSVFTNVIHPRSEIPRKDAFSPTIVRRGATLGANSTIVCGVEIGRYALVGAGAVVVEDVPAYALVLGVPAVRRGWACRCGLTLVQAPEHVLRCDACGNRYRESSAGLEVLDEVQQDG